MSYRIDPWKIIEEKFNPADSEFSESLFSVGNGFMGIRGNFEEKYSGQSLQGSYYAGIYYPDKTRVGWWKNGYPEYFAKVLNGISWIGLQIETNTEVLDLSKSRFSDYNRILDMQSGILTRSFIWHTEQGDLKISFERFCSFADKNFGAQQVTIQSIDYTGPIHIQSTLDFDVWNRDTNYDEQFWYNFKTEVIGDSLAAFAETRKTEFAIGAVCKHQINWEVSESHLDQTDKTISQKFKCLIKAAESVQFAKITAIQSSLYAAKDSTLEEAQTLLAGSPSYEELRQNHTLAWKNKWKDVDILIAGDDAAQQGIRYNIFQLLQTYRGDDPRLNIGPKGFTGEKYGGSTYWDTEAYCIPFYYHAGGPDVARQLLMYRYKHLDKAIENAQKLGFTDGAALYPMVTMNGEECHNEWEITFEEIHRNGAMVYAIKYYLEATGDTSYVFEYGLPVMVAIARFWNQRMNFSQSKQQYVILGVTGPNEYENNVHNNWYTNYIAKWCLDYVGEILDLLKESDISKYNAICKVLKVKPSEIKDWHDQANNIYFPYDPVQQIFLQQDGFLDKTIVPASSIPPAEYPIHKHWSWDRILRSCFIKQADVLQGLYFFEDDFSLEEIERHFTYYEPLTVHESSLSPCVHAILAAKIDNLEKSYEMYIRTSRLDLDNYNHDTDDGLHITSMAGTWMSIIYGFAGVRIKKGTIHLDPKLPHTWNEYQFKIIHQDAVIQVVVQRNIVEIKSDKSKEVILRGRSYSIGPNPTKIEL